MPRNRENIANEILEWEGYLSSIDTIPMNPNLTYNDENDVYERLTEFVKYWVEGMFGVEYTPGGLKNIPDDEMTTGATEWLAGVKGRLTPLAEDWYQFALNGSKDGADAARLIPALPKITTERTPDEEEKENAQSDIREGVKNSFLPAYRALRETFNKGWFFKWLFNHRQYVAERDALKVMTNVIKSMTGYTQKELDAEFFAHQKSITSADLQKARADMENLQRINPAEISEAAFKGIGFLERQENVDAFIMVDGRAEVDLDKVTGMDNEIYDPDDIKPNEENVLADGDVLDIDYDEEVEDNISAVERLQEYDDKEEIDKLCVKFMRVMKTTEANEESVYRAMHSELYPKIRQSAEFFCSFYDTLKMSYKGEAFKEQFKKLAGKSAKGMFETVFKTLGAEDEREIVTTVKGKEVRERVGGSLFGIATLKDRIIAAQRIANIMLNNRTPLAFYPELAGDFGRSYYIMENTDALSSYLKKNYADKYGESEINLAVKLAKNEASVKYRGAQEDMSYVFEIGYRPDPSRIEKEKSVLGEAQKMMMYGYIKDEKLKAVISENVNRWNQGRKMLNADEKTKAAAQKAWVDADKKLAEAYKDYDAKVTEEAVKNARVEHDAKKDAKKAGTEPLKVNLQEPKVDTVPPVQPKTAEISVPVNKK